MSEPLARCLEFVRALEVRCAEQLEPWQFGTAHFHLSLPRVWSLNFLAADDAGSAGARELAREADSVQGAARLEHRRIAVRDDSVGRRLAGGFAQLGWKVEPLLVMPYAAAGRVPDTSAVEEVRREELDPVWMAGKRASRHGRDEETVRQIVGQRRVIGEAGRARYFARFANGDVASYCELYSDGATGQIEGVLTLDAWRGRGFASAVVARALAESQAMGHDLTFLLALADDWPKELYRKLGFREAGRTWDFVREPPHP